MYFPTLDGKIFQEKVDSIVSLRHSSSGGRADPRPGLMLISPSGFTASPPEGRNDENESTTRSVLSGGRYAVSCLITTAPDVPTKQMEALECVQESISLLSMLSRAWGRMGSGHLDLQLCPSPHGHLSLA